MSGTYTSCADSTYLELNPDLAGRIKKFQAGDVVLTPTVPDSVLRLRTGKQFIGRYEILPMRFLEAQRR